MIPDGGSFSNEQAKAPISRGFRALHRRFCSRLAFLAIPPVREREEKTGKAHEDIDDALYDRPPAQEHSYDIPLRIDAHEAPVDGAHDDEDECDRVYCFHDDEKLVDKSDMVLRS